MPLELISFSIRAAISQHQMSSILNEQFGDNNLQLAMIDAPMLNLIVEPEVRRHANQ